jgi:putative endonuclease
MRTYWVYILASRTKVTYTGVTGNLVRRIAQHRAGVASRFTAKYGVTRLVHVEQTSEVLAAISREKEIKGWRRSKKVALVESSNPEWVDLAPEIGPWRSGPSLRSG